MKSLVDRPALLSAALTAAAVGGSLAMTLAIMALAGVTDRSFGLILAGVLPAVIAPVPSYVLARANRRLRDLRDELEHLAGSDPLTGLGNRRTFFARAPEILGAPSETLPVAAILMVDIDRFRWINDTHGHTAGDRVILAVATAISDAIRPESTDAALAARIGGEEFVLAIRSAAVSDALVTAERICRAVRKATFERAGRTVAPTVSIGVATFPGAVAVEDALKAADEAVYQAKRGGRDRWVRHQREAAPLDDIVMAEPETASTGESLGRESARAA